MKTFPIMLDVRGRLAVVVGGGRVGLRKAVALREAGADVRLVAKDIDPAAEGEGLTVIRSEYRPEHLAAARLVLACTDDAALNATIARDGRRIGAIVNVADQPDDCDFFLPAVVRDGDVVVAVGTGGSAPALAARLKVRLAAALPERIGEFAAILSQAREALKARLGDTRRRGEIIKRLADEATYELFLARGPAAVHARLEQLIAEAAAQRKDARE